MKHGMGWLLALVLLVGGGYAIYQYGPRLVVLVSPGKTATSQPVRTTPVVAVPARQGDLPIYLNGLGNVTPLNTVTVHTRVDGELIKVAFVEGQTVQKDDLLAELDPRPFQVQLLQAKGQLAKDQAQLENARLDVKRYEAAGEAASQQQRDTAAATVRQLEGMVVSDQSQIDNANLQLVYCRITSPLTGRVGLRLVDAGNIVHQSDPGGLVVIAQIEPITVIFTLPEDALPQIQKAMAGGTPLVTEAYDRDLRTHLATGSLMAIDNQIDPATGTVRLRAVFENHDHSLFPNQFVNARLLVDTKKAAVLIPSVAVQQSPQTTFVYVVDANETVEMRPIKVGPTEGSRTAVADGLAAGELVVTDGVDKLAPGMKVTVRTSSNASSQPSGRSRGDHAEGATSSTSPATSTSAPAQTGPSGHGHGGGDKE